MVIPMKTSVRKAKSVVVVEDQTAICELIIEMLEARGAYRVLGSTAAGNEGLALAKQLKPDILILDILLPGISGLEILRQLHETCLLYTSPSPRDRQKSRMPSSA